MLTDGVAGRSPVIAACAGMTMGGVHDHGNDVVQHGS
jgi:hypothetical protein